MKTKKILKEELESAKKRLKNIMKMKKNIVFKNSDIEILKIENQTIGQIQILQKLISII